MGWRYCYLQTLANFPRIWRCWLLKSDSQQRNSIHTEQCSGAVGELWGVGAAALPGTTMKGEVSTAYGNLEEVGICCHHGSEVPPWAGLACLHLALLSCSCETAASAAFRSTAVPSISPHALPRASKPYNWHWRVPEILVWDRTQFWEDTYPPASHIYFGKYWRNELGWPHISTWAHFIGLLVHSQSFAAGL